jgi:hypothetical protein
MNWAKEHTGTLENIDKEKICLAGVQAFILKIGL